MSSPQEEQNHETVEQVPSKKRLGSFFSRVKLRTKQWSRRRKTISEANLRKQLTKYAERGDWNNVRKLLSKHDFATIPMPTINGGDNNSHEAKSASADRRPSYGSSRNSFTRNSFTGKESAAAAAAIKAAALFDDDSSASDAHVASDNQHLDVGENILHDICRYKPPLDVIETLLTSLEHRRGYTSGKDDMGRSPLHVAAACGASPDIIEALALADPSPASMGDVDRRSPLHIAVRYLAYSNRQQEENHPQEENELLIPSPSSAPQTSLWMKKRSSKFPRRFQY
jgi:hypothetical protein